MTEMEDQGGEHSPGPAGGPGVSSEHDGLTVGTKKLCHRPDEHHTKPENGGRCTGIGQSPNAAPVDGSHTHGTSEVVEKERNTLFRQVWMNRGENEEKYFSD